MNAIIALCHFCESHGPCSVFTTQTLRDTKIDENLFQFEEDAKTGCAACYSIGHKLGMLSHDTESNANFLSSQCPVISDAVRMVKSAATRSLSCEVSSHKDGGIMFFGDAAHGHVLSHTFQIRDAQARGFFRLFSIVILMKDKSYLINIQPFLADALRRISTRLQGYAFATYSSEQSSGMSERAKRLTAGQANTQAPRSLVVLTGEKYIFAHLHTHFSWILWSGARCLTETVALGCPTVPPWMDKDTEEGFTMINMDKEEWLLRHQNPNLGAATKTIGEQMSMRGCKDLLGSEFTAACFCVLIGIQIVLRGPPTKTEPLLKCLMKLLPHKLHRFVHFNSTKYLSSGECRLVSVSPEVAVPQPTSAIFRVDFIAGTSTDDNSICVVKWPGELPSKLPDLLLKINKSVNERLFNDLVLEKHLTLLVEEWKNKVSCIMKIHSNHELIKLRKILGIQQQDLGLVNYWATGL